MRTKCSSQNKDQHKKQRSLSNQSAFFSLTGVKGVGENNSPAPPEPSSSAGTAGARLRSHSLISVVAVLFRLPGLNFVKVGQVMSSLVLLKREGVVDFGVELCGGGASIELEEFYSAERGM